jgi:hypothetical protein
VESPRGRITNRNVATLVCDRRKKDGSLYRITVGPLAYCEARNRQLRVITRVGLFPSFHGGCTTIPRHPSASRLFFGSARQQAFDLFLGEGCPPRPWNDSVLVCIPTQGSGENSPALKNTSLEAFLPFKLSRSGGAARVCSPTGCRYGVQQYGIPQTRRGWRPSRILGSGAGFVGRSAHAGGTGGGG